MVSRDTPRARRRWAALTILLAAVAGLTAAAPASAFMGHDGSQWDGSQWDGARWDGSQWDGARWDGARWDGSQWDAARWDGARWDGSQWDGARWDAARWDASRWATDAFVGFDPLYAHLWNLRATHVAGAWALMGPGDRSATICFVDAGIDATHADLASAWSGVGRDFVEQDDMPDDPSGHGTHVASIAAARAGDGHGIAGIANARILVARVVDAMGLGTNAAYVRGIHWCADQGADILSISLSVTGRSQGLSNAVNYAVARGALVVLSSGNTDCDACYGALVKLPGTLVVAPIDPDGHVASFSRWHSAVDIGAPGVHVPGALSGGGWALGSGASQAVPHVSGTAALVMMANPTLTAAEVADILLASAARIGPDARPFLDAESAVKLALER